MSEQISSDFYKVPNVKIDILRLRTELEDVLKKKKFNTLGISHFGAISINRIPGDEESIKGHNTRGAYWTYPCLLYTSPSPRDRTRSRMPSSA